MDGLQGYGPLRGRGASANPPNRFERISSEIDPALFDEGEAPRPETTYLRDSTRSIIARNSSPDVGFETSVNPYRGCENGCVYCFARPNHEQLGFSAGLDFETKILVKERAPELLRQELSSPRWKPQVIALSGVTDCYQPIERKLRITRGCLEVLAECRNPVAIVTKNHLVTRDLDLLAGLARHEAAVVCVSVTSLDPALQRRMEPRTSSPSRRLDAIERLARAGVPVGVLVAPIVPGLTDHEAPAVLRAAADAGARFAGHVLLRLPWGIKELFDQWLGAHYPDRKEKVLARVREMRGGRLNDPRFGSRKRGSGTYAENLEALFHAARRKAGIPSEMPQLSTAAFRRPPGAQGRLFE